MVAPPSVRLLNQSRMLLLGFTFKNSYDTSLNAKRVHDWKSWLDREISRIDIERIYIS